MIQFPDFGTTPAVPDSIPSPRQELAELKSLSFDELVNRIVGDLIEFAIHLAIAIMVFYAGKYLIKKLYNFIGTVMRRRKTDQSLITFVLSLVKIALYFILLVTVIGILGINTSSFIAIFASVGVAIGMALSGTLQNFAGGVLILLLKPYRVGDYISAQGYEGTVTDIQIFSTIICTGDNKSIIVPNGGLSTGTINNWSKQDFRRVQWDIGISYGDDFMRAAKEIHSILRSVKEVVFVDADDKIIPNPEATVSAREAQAELNGSIENFMSFNTDDKNHETVTDKSAGQPATSSPPSLPEAEMTNGDDQTKEPERPKRANWIVSFFRKRHERLVQREKEREAEIKKMGSRGPYNPTVNLAALADSSVNLVVRAWVKTPDYWAVYYYVLQEIYARQQSTVYSFPFPQMDVHLVKSE